jgi:hypothetical protein
MKKLVIVILGFVMMACGQEQQVSMDALIHSSHRPSTETKRPTIPAHIFLHDSEGNKIGMAVSVQGQIFVTADHLKEKYDKLFWKTDPIHIIARAFEDDLLFFEMDTWMLDAPVWSTHPPVLGEPIFWIDETSSLTTEEVRSISENIQENSLKTERIVISGIAQLPNSGSPIFGDRGQVFGILVGADRFKDISYAVRSDKILKILKEHLE